ncbi:hypothetical protein Trydic_g883 [Trypoxylus dichotomus]
MRLSENKLSKVKNLQRRLNISASKVGKNIAAPLNLEYAGAVLSVWRRSQSAMGNASTRPHPRQRNKKQVHWKAAVDRPTRPGKPQLIADTDGTPDVITIHWDRPLKDGGSPITGYLVEHRRTGSPHWVRATPLLVPFPELTLSGLEPGWRYQFRVCAENAVGLSDPSELSEPLTVTLQRSAVTSPRFTQELADSTALENDKVEFVVYFLGQPPPKISWFKDGFEIFSSRRIRILTECDRSVLTIHQSQLVDAGEIRCSATNKAGHASTKAMLTLEAPPTIRLPRQYEDGLLFEIGEVIRLKISIAGLPVPLVFWSHNGESIQNTERYEIENSENSTTLRITEAKRSDRGEYQVKAINKLGQDQTSFLVTVTDKPSPPDDGGCKIGNYIIEYYRLGWDVWLKAATSRQLNTVLGDLIEDKKRGILEPSPRSASQPREIAVGRETVPELPQRKHKPRSQSSSRADDHHVQFNIPNGVPVRPERKLKSPQRTPEASPGVIRRELKPETINKDIFDRASITRDIIYGTPEFKITTSETPMITTGINPVTENLEEAKPKSTIQIIDNKRPRSPSPIKAKSPSPTAALNHITKPPMQTLQVERSKSPTPERIIKESRRSRSPTPQETQQLERHERSPSPAQNQRLQNTRSPSPNFARRNSKDFTGSSEFMLVLLPNGNKEREAIDIDVSFDENQIPPPLSLSAPELGTDPPVMEGLKYSSSSTELLHERAMIRFYEAAKAEELELKRKLEKKDSQERRPSIIPKIQINSLDEDDVILERKVSLRRRYSAGISTPQQVLWAQRRHSLRNSGDLTEIFEGKLRRYPLSIEERREIMMNRKRSESEEKEEVEFEKVRTRMSQKPSTPSDKTVNVADLSKWDQYEESISESSEDERIYDQVPEVGKSEDEEDSTYHPSMQATIERRIVTEPFEILTKPNKLPDPNFVPKPILKRSAGIDLPSVPKSPILFNDTGRRSKSPSPTSGISKTTERRPSSPLLKITTDSRTRSPSLVIPESKLGNQVKRGSLPWSAPLALAINEENGNEKEINRKPLPSITAIASVSGVTAAGIIIPQSILAKKVAEEEAKVVVDHYSDIVRNYSQQKHTRPSNLTGTYETDEIELSQSPSPPPMEMYDEETLASPSSSYELRNSSMYNTENLPSKQMLPTTMSSIHNTVAAPLLIEQTSRKAYPYDTEITSNEHVKNYNGNIRSRTNSSSSSQRSLSPTKSGRIRRGSPTVLNKDVATFRIGRDPLPREEKESSRSSSQIRTPSKSPGRRKKSSESPRRWLDKQHRSVETSTFSVQTETPTFRKSPSPVEVRRPPKMKEIMTQTSACLDNFIADTAAKISAPFKNLSDEQLKEYAEKKVRTTVDYVTDLAMFVVACWLYLFKNELLAIPVLLVMVYRQLQAEISKRIPKWLIPKRKKQT